MKLKDLGAMSNEELQKRISEFRRELSAERAAARRGGRIPNPKRIRTLRRLIAKGLTILRERELKAKARKAKK